MNGKDTLAPGRKRPQFAPGAGLVVENKVTLQTAHSDKRGKPGGFPGALIEDKIVTDRQQFAGSQDFASGEHNFSEFEKCFLLYSYGSWLLAIRIDTIGRLVIILTVGKIGNSLLFQPLELQGDWRKIQSVRRGESRTIWVRNLLSEGGALGEPGTNKFSERLEA